MVYTSVVKQKYEIVHKFWLTFVVWKRRICDFDFFGFRIWFRYFCSFLLHFHLLKIDTRFAQGILKNINLKLQKNFLSRLFNFTSFLIWRCLLRNIREANQGLSNQVFPFMNMKLNICDMIFGRPLFIKFFCIYKTKRHDVYDIRCISNKKFPNMRISRFLGILWNFSSKIVRL